MKSKLIPYSLLLISSLMLFTQTVKAQATEQLIVFINPEKAVLEATDLKAFQTLATALNIELKTIGVDKGVPQLITQTPSIVFQDTEGRSVYYGRYKNITRLKNFIRTSRLAHQQDADNYKNDILLWRNEKAIITAPLKVTDLTGEVPNGFNQADFKKAVKVLVSQGMSNFKLIDRFNQSRTNRIFYVDLHPYIDAGKNLVIKSEIYSQFNCVKPIVQFIDTPIHTGKWKNWKNCFKEVGQQIEQEVIQQIQNSKIGDAFEPVPESTPIRSWDELGIPLPTKIIAENQSNLSDIVIPKNWTVEAPKANESIVMFSFLAPLDNYAGEVKALTGTLKLNDNGSLKESEGNFEVKIADITMGAEDFDYEVQNKMLQMLNFPMSSFVFEKVKGGEEKLAFGKVSTIEVTGIFSMLGIPLSLTVPATIKPILNADGEVRLQVNTTFQLPLFENFKVVGPDGPSPAKDTLQFYMKFFLKPL